MPRRAPSFPHLLPNLITDHKPFVSRECVETAIDALVANDGGSRRWRKDVVCALDRLSDRTVPTILDAYAYRDKRREDKTRT